jgi:hypothetical protein
MVYSHNGGCLAVIRSTPLPGACGDRLGAVFGIGPATLGCVAGPDVVFRIGLLAFEHLA